MIHHFFNRYVQTLPMIRPSIKPESAISRSRSLAYLGEQPAIAATSIGCTLADLRASLRASSITSDVNFLTVTGLGIYIKHGLEVYKCYVTYSGT